MLVHGEQEMVFHKPIKPEDRITSSAKVKSTEDKGSGELAVINVTSKDRTGEKVVESDWGIFVMGMGSGQKRNDERKEGVHGEGALRNETRSIYAGGRHSHQRRWSIQPKSYC